MTWDERFQNNDTPWQRPGLNPAFTAWFGCQSLSGCRVLVPGCGTAPELAEFARAGAAVTGLDIAPTAIARQRMMLADAHLDANLVVGSITDWRPAMPFDMLYEQTCLCAVPPDRRIDYERFAFESLRRGGKLYALFMQTNHANGPPYHCDLTQMHLLFTRSRWLWRDAEPLKSEHPLGVHELGFVLERI